MTKSMAILESVPRHSIKWVATLFDQIGIPDTIYDMDIAGLRLTWAGMNEPIVLDALFSDEDKQKQFFQYNSDLPFILDELDWLVQQEIMCPLRFDVSAEQAKQIKVDPQYVTAERDYLTATENYVPMGMHTIEEKEREAAQRRYVARLTAAKLRLIDGINAYPIVEPESFYHGKEADKTEVLCIVLRNLPKPDESVPWEQIIEFRNDQESRMKFLRLRNWINEIAKVGTHSSEIEEKLEYLLHEYELHLKIHKMKYSYGLIEGIVTIGSEVLENVIKIKWSDAAKSLFSLKHKRAQLLEAEVTSPGAEVAYILEAKKRFG